MLVMVVVKGCHSWLIDPLQSLVSHIAFSGTIEARLKEGSAESCVLSVHIQCLLQQRPTLEP